MSLKICFFALTLIPTFAPPLNKSTNVFISSGNKGNICFNNLYFPPIYLRGLFIYFFVGILHLSTSKLSFVITFFLFTFKGLPWIYINNSYNSFDFDGILDIYFL